jgi:aryl-alcohol dehydrogenase-like predicted oxidoreductase
VASSSGPRRRGRDHPVEWGLHGATAARRHGAHGVPHLLGCGSFGGIGSDLETLGHGLNEAQAFEVLDAGTALGINVLDTANSYAWGESERIVGRWLAARDADVLVATKVGREVRPGWEGIDLSFDRVLEQFELSRKRLARDRVQLYLSHVPDDHTPVEQTLAAFGTLIEQGSVDAVGACHVTAEELRRALAAAERRGLPRYEWVQNEYNLLTRRDEEELLAICADHGLGYTPYSPPAGGVLSGRYQAGAPLPPDSRVAVRPGPYAHLLTRENLDGVSALAAEARRRGVSLSGLALAWVPSHPQVTAPLVAPRRVDQFDAVQEALALTLDPDERDQLVSLFPG